MHMHIHKAGKKGKSTAIKHFLRRKGKIFSTADNDAAKFDPQWVKPDGKVCRFNPWPYPIA